MNSEKNRKIKKPFRISRLVGYGLFIFGVANIADMFSAIPIPTVGASAIFAGIFFMAIGAFILIPDKSSWMRKLQDFWKKGSQAKVTIDPLLPVRILKLAQEHDGILTQSMVAIELAIPLDQAEAGLQECVRFGHASPDFDMEKELKYYKFQEHLPPKTGG